MNPARLADLFRAHAQLHGELAEVDTQIAEELAAENVEDAPRATERRRPVRTPYVPPARPLSDAARAKAKRGLKRHGVR